MSIPFKTSVCLFIVFDFSRCESIATIFRQLDIDEVLWVTASLSGDYATASRWLIVCWTTGASKNDYPWGLVSYIFFFVLLKSDNCCLVLGKGSGEASMVCFLKSNVSLWRLPLKLKGLRLETVVDGFLYANSIGEPPFPARGTTEGPYSGKQKSYLVDIS